MCVRRAMNEPERFSIIQNEFLERFIQMAFEE
jgi:hypothetical protein